jgi:hypothetical protein
MWHGGQGQAAKAVVKIALYSSKWITFVITGSFLGIGGSKRWHNWFD